MFLHQEQVLHQYQQYRMDIICAGFIRAWNFNDVFWCDTVTHY
jgi:hypothetical protein